MLKEAFARVGRDPDSALVSVYSSLGEPERIEQYRTANVHRVVLSLPAGPERDVLNTLDRYTKVLAVS